MRVVQSRSGFEPLFFRGRGEENAPGRFVYAVLAGAALAFVVSTPVSAIVITEIHYHPDAARDPEQRLEFVEIYNEASIVQDLSGYYFAEGIRFVFPENTFIAARAYLVIAADAAAIRDLYGIENVLGDFDGRLANDGEDLRLVSHVGAPIARVRYSDRGVWPAATDGTGYTLTLKDPLDDPENPESWTRSAQRGGTPGGDNFSPPEFVDVEIFPAGGTWRYRKGWDADAGEMREFSDPVGAWRTPDFDDAAWPEGQTPIGYGEDEIVTPLDDMQGQYLSFAARRRFAVEAERIESMVSLVLKVRVDDGFVAYLNGEEVVRFNVPGDVGTDLGVEERATNTVEFSQEREFSIPIERVKAGENLLAVQVQNLSFPSNDAAFDAGLFGRGRLEVTPRHVPTVVFNEFIVATDARDGRALELYNSTASPVDLSGFHVTDAPESPRAYTFSDGTVLAARQFLALSEETLGFPLEGPTISAFLYRPDGETLQDAAAVDAPVDVALASMSRSRLPDGSGDWFLSGSPTPGESNRVALEDGVVINEIQYNPMLMDVVGRLDAAPERAEYVELFNRSDRAISLSGWSLACGIRFAFAPDQLLEPGGYLVVARDMNHMRVTYGLRPGVDVVGPVTAEQLADFGVLGDGEDTIRLVDELGNIVDEVRYSDGGDWDPLADGGGSSLELIDPFQDNSSPHAWQASDESRKAPWFEISYTATYPARLGPATMEPEMHVYLHSGGECLIDGASITAAGDEFVPNGDFESDTRPWRIWGNHTHSFRTTEEARIGSASLHVVATGGGNSRINGLEVDTGTIRGGAAIRVSLWARWLRGCNALHVSGDNNAFGKTVWLPIPSQTGSPGRENGARAALREATGSANLGPVISRVHHEPAVPLPGQPLRFRARVTDPDGVESVVVRYEVDGRAGSETVTLHDDGEHDDGAPGDGEYSGELDGFAIGTVISFRVEARDSAGRAHSYPRETVRGGALTFVVDEPLESSVQRLRIAMSQENLSTLSRRQLHSNDLVDGTVIFEERKVFYNVGIRYRGSAWNRPGSPRQFRVRFNGDNQFGRQAKRLNISRNGRDHKEASVYHFVRKASRPGATAPYSPTVDYASMKVNATDHSSFAMELFRPIDRSYAEFNWPDDSEGLAWKVNGKIGFNDSGARTGQDWAQFRVYRDGPWPGSDSVGENYRYYYDPKMNKCLDSFDGLIRMLRAMDQSTTPDAVYDEVIDRTLNVESWFRVFLVRILVSDGDTMNITNGHNAYIYHAPVEDRFYLLPWDLDVTFGNAGASLGPAGPNTIGIGRLTTRPGFKRLYASVMKELVEGPFSREYYETWTRLVAETTLPARVSAASPLVSFVANRARTAEGFYRSALNTPFSITTPSPAEVTTDSVSIRGTAPLEVWQIQASLGGETLADIAPAWSGSSIPVDWEIEVSGLVPGRNVVDVFAFDRDGDLVDSASIEILRELEVEPPEVLGVLPFSGPASGGTLVRIRGAGFSEGATVRFGPSTAPAVETLSPIEISAVTPPGEPGTVTVIVANPDGQEGRIVDGFTYVESTFIRGDANVDGRINLTDPLMILGFLVRGGSLRCHDAADVNDDGDIDITDAARLLEHLFARGPAPAPPYPTAGADSTGDALGCE